MSDLLNGLSLKEKIYDLHYNNYVFHYKVDSFGQCGVVVRDVDENYWGNNSKSYSNIANKFLNSVTDNKILIAFDGEESINNLCFEDLKKFIDDNSDKRITLEKEISLNLFKSFDLYKEICLFSHGFYDEDEKKPIIWTQENVPNKISKEYKNLGNKGAIGAYINSHSEMKFVIFPAFFEECYEKDDLKDDIFFFGVCEAFGDNSVINNAFYESLSKAGVGAVIGFCNSVNQSYCHLLFKETMSNYFDGMTINDSLESAKNIWGYDQNDYYMKHTTFENETHPALPVFQGKKELKYDSSTTIQDITESEIEAKIQENTTKPILHLFYDDYDADGKHEAFVIVGTPEADEGWYYEADLLFINADGVLKLKEGIYGYPNGILKEKKYSFLSLEKSAHGSGSVSYVFGVKDGEPIEMNISEDYGSFSVDDDFVFKGYTSDFSKGSHDYIWTEFSFDDTNFQFLRKNDNERSSDQNPYGEYFGNQTAEELKKSIVGIWGEWGNYVFYPDGSCYWNQQKEYPGTYEIREDKTLVISFPWTKDIYVWDESSKSLSEFRQNHPLADYYWFLSDEDCLDLKGISYSRQYKNLPEGWIMPGEY